MQKSLLFVFNPNTGGGRLKNRLMEIVCEFSAAGYSLSVYPTAGPGDAKTHVIHKAEGFDLLVCCGGDGTLNEVVEGLMQLKKPPLLGYIPGGTTNDFASSLLLPKTDMMAAVSRILHPKKIFSMDVGVFNERNFTYVAAFGAFTDVSYSTPQSFKNVVGYLAYVVEALSKLPNLGSFHARVETDAGVLEEDFMFGMVANSVSIGGFSLPERAAVELDDGIFEVMLVIRPHKITDLGGISAALMSKKLDSPYLKLMRVRHITVTSDEPIAWTLDGEFGGKQQETVISVKEKALRICI